LDSIIGGGVEAVHGVTKASDALSVTTAIISVFVRTANKTWLYLENAGVANCWCYFNVGGGVTGSSGAGSTAKGIENYGGGLYRCWMRFTAAASPYTFKIAPADGDGDNSYTGTGTADLYVGCVTVDKWEIPRIYTPSVASPGVRSADSPYYTITGVSATEGSLFFRFLCPAFQITNIKYLLALSADASVNNQIVAQLNASGYLSVASASTGLAAAPGLVTGSVNYRDGAIHSVLITWIVNSLKVYVDGVLIGTDSAVDVPVGLNRLSLNNKVVPDGLGGYPVAISDVQVFNTSDKSRLKLFY